MLVLIYCVTLTLGDGLYASFDFGTDYPKAPPYLQQFDYESNLKAKIQDIIDYFKSLGKVQGQVLGFCFGGWLLAHIFASDDQNKFFSCGAIGHPSITFEEAIYGRYVCMYRCTIRTGSIVMMTYVHQLMLYILRNTAALIEKIQKPLLLFPAKGDPQEYNPDGAFFLSLKERFPTSASYPIIEENHGFWPRGSCQLDATTAVAHATATYFAAVAT